MILSNYMIKLMLNISIKLLLFFSIKLFLFLQNFYLHYSKIYIFKLQVSIIRKYSMVYYIVLSINEYYFKELIFIFKVPFYK